jgi:hypothetical protein
LHVFEIMQKIDSISVLHEIKVNVSSKCYFMMLSAFFCAFYELWP